MSAFSFIEDTLRKTLATPAGIFTPEWISKGYESLFASAVGSSFH